VSLDPTTPVLVGVGQVSERVDDVATAPEPVELIAEAARRADTDAGARRSLLPTVDTVAVVQIVSWRYPDPGRAVAARLGIAPARSITTTTGGNSPQMLLNHLAGEIQAGRVGAALLCGGDAIDARWRARRDGTWLPWPEAPDGRPDLVLGDNRPGNNEAEIAVGLSEPVAVYPLLESALRAEAGETIPQHQERVSELWARFSEVAAANPYAWSREPRTAADIRTVTPQNRMIGFPYPKLMNSRIDVDQSAALLLCSVRSARDLGVPSDRWVFPLAGADATDHYWVSERADLHSSPAIRIAGQRVLELAGIGIDEVAHVDLYSCFPSAVQIAAAELGIDTGRALTVTGGLGFAGGPVNNYATHAIATMADRLRESDGDLGLCTAVGWYLTKHSLGVYSTRPRDAGFVAADVQREIDATPTRPLSDPYDGPITIEGYTVMHDRDGTPTQAIAAGLTPNGKRTWAASDDRALAEAMTREEHIGRSATLTVAGRSAACELRLP